MAFLIATTVTIGALSDLNGKNYIPNAPIEIRARNTNGSSGALSTIFSDQAGANPITQVGATANASGQFSFFAEAGPYNAVYNDGVQVVTIPLDIGGATVSKKIPITVIQDQLTYAYPSTVVGVTNVLVSGNTLHETEVAYVDDPIAKTITLSEGLSSGEIMEWWANSIPSTESGASTGINSFANAATAAAQLLGSLSAFTTLSGITAGDEFGGTFGRTGIVTIGKAGTVEVDTASVYDGIGIQFTLVGNKIRLETLGVSYSNSAADTLSKIIALRTTGFNIDLSTRYSLTTFPDQKNIYNTQTEIIIHRGFSDLAPENTKLAASIAINRTQGQNISMEIDVQMSSDGIPVVFHDLSVDNYTDGTGVVTSLTLAQLKVLKFVDHAPTGRFGTVGTAFENGTTIPTLDEFVEFLSEKGVKIYPEIKAYRTVADIEIMNDVIRKYRYENSTTWTSFQISDLQELRKYNQLSNTGWATGGSFTQTDLDDLFELGQTVNIIQSINDWLNNPSDIDVFHSYGFDCVPFTPDRTEFIQSLSAIGIHKFITDKNLTPSSGMNVIPLQRKFEARPNTQIQSGSGAITFTANPQNAQTAGEIVELSGGIGGIAHIVMPFSLTAGEVKQLQIFARNTAGNPDESQIDIDKGFGSRFDTVNIKGTDWIEYQIPIQGIFNEVGADVAAAIVLGSTTTRDNGAIFYRPIMKSSDSLSPSSEIIMDGRIFIGPAAAYTTDPDINNIGIDTIQQASGDALAIDIRPQFETNTNNTEGSWRPKVDITDGNTNQDIEYVDFKADTVGNTGIVRVTGYDGTGTKIDMNNLTNVHSLSLIVRK